MRPKIFGFPFIQNLSDFPLEPYTLFFSEMQYVLQVNALNMKRLTEGAQHINYSKGSMLEIIYLKTFIINFTVQMKFL